MPRSVAGAQPSNQHAQPGEAGHIAPEADVTVSDTENVTVQEADPSPVPEQIAADKPAKTGKKAV